MSLVAWYPLNKDFRNLGDSDFDIVNSNVTFSNGGKIGKAATFNGSNSRLYTTKDVSINGNNISLCAWFYKNVDAEGYIASLNNNTGYVDNEIGLDTNGNILYFVAGGNSNLQTNFVKQQWNCAIVTYDGVTITGYLNGEKIGILNNVNPLNKPHFTIGARSNNISGAGSAIQYPFNGMINDVRLYNHCLSEAEAKEVSKAKILHYNFESIYGMKNLLKNSKNERSVTRNGSNIFIDYDYSSELSTTTERTFTVSADVKGSIDGLITDFYFRNTAGNLMNPETRIIPTTEYKRYTITLTLSDGQNISDFRIFRFRLQSNGTIYIKNVKLTYGNGDSLWSPNPEDSDYDSDVGNIIYDSSGYGHKGQLKGNAHYITSSVFGNYSINFNGIGDFIDIGNYAPYWWTTGDKVPELTLSSWFKVDSNFDWSYSPNLIAFCGNAFIRYRLQSSTSLWAYGKTGDEETSINRSITKTCKNLQDEKWHNAIFTFKNGMAKLYLDGENIGESDWSSNNHTTLYCGSNNAWYVGTYFANSENFVGNIDDVRIYATALTDNDIKYLYNERVKIDNIGNIYCSELNEEERVVEYIESTGTQWIDTGVKLFEGLFYDITFKHNDIGAMYGRYVSQNGNNIISQVVNGSLWNTYGNGATAYLRYNSDDGNYLKHNIKVQDYKMYLDGILVAENNNAKIITEDEPFYLFRQSGIYGKGRIYHCKIYNGNLLIRDFLPIISTEDGHIGEPCLFDTVENKYYYNQGTGTFLTNLSTSITNVNVTDKGILNCRYLIEGNDPAKVLKDENIVKVNEIKEN